MKMLISTALHPMGPHLPLSSWMLHYGFNSTFFHPSSSSLPEGLGSFQHILSLLGDRDPSQAVLVQAEAPGVVTAKGEP